MHVTNQYLVQFLRPSPTWTVYVNPAIYLHSHSEKHRGFQVTKEKKTKMFWKDLWSRRQLSRSPYNRPRRLPWGSYPPSCHQSPHPAIHPPTTHSLQLPVPSGFGTCSLIMSARVSDDTVLVTPSNFRASKKWPSWRSCTRCLHK